MNQDAEEKRYRELAEICRELGTLLMRLRELSSQLRAKKQEQAVHYFLGMAQGALNNLLLEESRSVKRKPRRS